MFKKFPKITFANYHLKIAVFAPLIIVRTKLYNINFFKEPIIK